MQQPAEGGVPTLSTWLRDATARLGSAGSESPRPEAEHLAAHGLGVRWSELWTRLRDPLRSEHVDALDELVERRAAGEPLAYIQGSAVFYGLELACGPGVLVPRPETETLVDVVLEVLPPGPGRVVDIGTGTGAIALAVAHHRPGAEVWATERSLAAIAYARRNLEGSAVTLCEGDLFHPLPTHLGGDFDVVVSNPPYIPTGRTDLLGPGVSAEPPEALFAGPTGDEVLRRLTDEATAWLKPGGALALEVGTPDQADRVTEMLGAWDETTIRSDHTDRPRVVWARLPKR